MTEHLFTQRNHSEKTKNSVIDNKSTQGRERAILPPAKTQEITDKWKFTLGRFSEKV